MGQSQLAGLPGLHQNTPKHSSTSHPPRFSWCWRHTTRPCPASWGRIEIRISAQHQVNYLSTEQGSILPTRPSARPGPKPKPHVLRLDHHHRQTRTYCCALAWTAWELPAAAAAAHRSHRPRFSGPFSPFTSLTPFVPSLTHRTFGPRLPPAPSNAF
ncbi:hypothetical protein GQ607_011328 [Colletotrichum asianum]|uniref:Uncharacterized protein n=1 Tax=Colletotrichum asianum TaxID=702518 RepID=A0A8H3W596_9PEZI|nr:hypothetical protein GQ607_011328 [Colletotrichum asianum]